MSFETNANKSEGPGDIETKLDDAESHDDAEKLNQTLAQQIAEDEQAMWEKSRQQQDAIDEEIRRTQPLVSPKDTIDTLATEFDPEKSPEYFQKSLEFGEHYSHLRRIRGDGNCFYRAMLVGQLERCLADVNELNRFVALVKGWRDDLLKLGMPELTTGDFCDTVEQLLEGITSKTIVPQMLFDNLNDDNIANYYVAFLRLIASGYLRKNSDTFSGFIEGGRSLDQYCHEEIEAMWKECDHLSIIALVNAMEVSIRIEYMDRTQAPNGGWHHDFSVEGQSGPLLWFLYRPGHYDILYPADKTAFSQAMI